jgi:hypothetical protein
LSFRQVDKKHMDFDLGMRRSAGRCTGPRCRRRAVTVWDCERWGLRAFCDACRRQVVGLTRAESEALAQEAAKRQGSLF